MITPAATWTPEQFRAAYAAMQAHAERCRDHPFGKNMRGPSLVLSRIRTGELQAALIGGGYLLVYDVALNWCSEEPLLSECLFLKALPTGTFSAAVADMVALAKDSRCLGIVTGNGVLRAGLRRLYEREGFRLLNESYYLEIPQ